MSAVRWRRPGRYAAPSPPPWRPRELALHDLRAEYARDDAGHPLGHGYPTGSSLREDGESHRDAWMRILRDDPCSYCPRAPGGTVDHVEPRSRPAKGPGGAHTWANFAGACEWCNQKKGARPLVVFLAVRATSIRR